MTSSAWAASFEAADISAMQIYKDVLVPRLFTPWARLLLDRLDLQPGEAALDVACGPGSVTRPAALSSNLSSDAAAALHEVVQPSGA
jgi:ubiquinone/menaquinone biosynthesis C-methylase UbiE